jgi:AcrR family transcriptional regulator
MAIDRRVQRTRTALYDALVRLIRRKPYGRISVEDILVEADVGRSTFYAHFRSKDELLDRSLDRLKALLLEEARGKGEDAGTLARVSRVLFAHVGEYRDIHASLSGDRQGSHVLHGALARVVGEVLSQTLPPGAANSVPRVLAIDFVVATFATVLGWWFDRHPEQDSGDVDRLFRRLAAQGLGEAWRE